MRVDARPNWRVICDMLHDSSGEAPGETKMKTCTLRQAAIALLAFTGAMLSGNLEADSETLLYHKEGGGGGVRGEETYEAETSAFDWNWSRMTAEEDACNKAKNRAKNLGGTRFSLCDCKSVKSDDDIGTRKFLFWEWKVEEGYRWGAKCYVKYSRR